MKGAFRRKLESTERTAAAVSPMGGIALLLACLGIGGTIAYAVSQRTKEIGIRMALGAEPQNVLSAMVLKFVTPVAAGLLVGTSIAALLSQYLRNQLFGLEQSGSAHVCVCRRPLPVRSIHRGALPAAAGAARGSIAGIARGLISIEYAIGRAMPAHRRDRSCRTQWGSRAAHADPRPARKHAAAVGASATPRQKDAPFDAFQEVREGHHCSNLRDPGGCERQACSQLVSRLLLNNRAQTGNAPDPSTGKTSSRIAEEIANARMASEDSNRSRLFDASGRSARYASSSRSKTEASKRCNEKPKASTIASTPTPQALQKGSNRRDRAIRRGLEEGCWNPSCPHRAS